VGGNRAQSVSSSKVTSDITLSLLSQLRQVDGQTGEGNKVMFMQLIGNRKSIQFLGILSHLLSVEFCKHYYSLVSVYSISGISNSLCCNRNSFESYVEIEISYYISN